MALELRVIPVTDDAGIVCEPEWLERAQGVHRQLRPQIRADYSERLQEIFHNGGRLAVVADGGSVVCVALWRVVESTFVERRLYVDDLVSDDSRRSQGAGKKMLDWLEVKAKALGCDELALDSGVQRARAHRFYFREGFHISAYCLKKVLK